MLKQRVRDCIDPKRDLGHSDVGGKKKGGESGEGAKEDTVETSSKSGDGNGDGDGDRVKRNPDGTVCEDCR